MLQQLEKAVDGINNLNKEALIKFVIVGGGPAGVEMAGSLAEFKKYLLKNDSPEIETELMEIILIQPADRILPMMSQKASSHALKTLQKLDVNVMLNSRVLDYDGDTISIKREQTDIIINARTVIWTAGVKGNALNGIPEASIVPGNRLKVNTYGQVDGFENIFAIGDVAAMITEEKPKGHLMVAQVTIQQGQLLAQNLINKVKYHKFTKSFHYKNKGSMTTIGKKDAVADLKHTFLNGRIGWVLWSFIHLISITGFKNRYKVGFNWMMKYFSYEKVNQFIINKYQRK